MVMKLTEIALEFLFLSWKLSQGVFLFPTLCSAQWLWYHSSDIVLLLQIERMMTCFLTIRWTLVIHLISLMTSSWSEYHCSSLFRLDHHLQPNLLSRMLTDG